jgi:hypothetical protein
MVFVGFRSASHSCSIAGVSDFSVLTVSYVGFMIFNSASKNFLLVLESFLLVLKSFLLVLKSFLLVLKSFLLASKTIS